ncbi:hypothetical protein KUV62_10730 [Salipiger bermudensis]|uniref:hypothetical protein n=1 Tax=Salipiger bermudensis TaxID=344736 RepID=UPI001C98F9E1|nr:hypothetical protein [Salipiger bermudensis]MBY6004386.1 hypothetical protein [Salipiger bermudensis]
MRRLLPPLAAFAAAMLLLMGWYAGTVLIPAAGGLWPLDMRPLGFSVAAAQDYVVALEGRGRAVILLEMRWLGAGFAWAFALLMALGLLRLSRGRAIWLRALLLLPVAAYLGADWAEGVTVRELLLRGPTHFLPLLAEWAALFTRMKAGFAALSLGLLAWLWWLERRQG